MKVNVTVSQDWSGMVVTITDEPYASAQATIDGLGHATDNATYRGCRFGRELQRKLGHTRLNEFCCENWGEVRAAGGGVLDIDQDRLDAMIARAAEIERILETAQPAKPTYQCAEPGCGTRVSRRGDMCQQCRFDS